MSSTLVMVLAAAMGVAGNGPENVSTEMEQTLDMRGEWRGTWHGSHGGFVNVRFCEGTIELTEDNGEGLGARVAFTDEGKGNFRLRIDDDDDRVYLGIYRQEGDRVIACLGGNRRPRDFKPSERHDILFIVHRVKPRK
jgi:hypothetical protein